MRPVVNALVCGLLFGCAPASRAKDAGDVRPTPIFRFEGDVQLRNGSALHYQAILIPDPAASGQYLGTIDIPKQAMSGAALQTAELAPGEHVEFSLNAAGHPRWFGAYANDGAMACEFTQSGVLLPCTMREIKDVPAAAPQPPFRAQTPLPPFPYASEDVRFVNPTDHVLLAGTLSIPAGAGPHPGLVLIGDLGVRDRDGSLSGHKPWLVLADHLARAGIAVLRMDPRGAGPEGKPPSGQGVELADRESDTHAGLTFLGSRPEIDPRRLGLIGHGYGASVAASLGRQPGVELIVLLAPSALPGREVLARRAELDALANGSSPQVAGQLREDVLAALAIIESEPLAARTRERLTALSQGLSARAGHETAALTLDQMLALAETPGIRELAAHNPAPLLRAVNDPVLALVPERDREVDASENLTPLRAALAHLPVARIETLARLNHRFQTADSGAPAEYERLSETFAPAALDLITSWIREVARLREPRSDSEPLTRSAP